jgi:RNA polymerase sigma-70 factor (ECF subfamily)
LLVRLRDPRDGEAWQQFVQVYAAVVYGFARKRGLQDADAADLMQDVFRAISTAIGRLEYDPQRGTFRSWLFTVTRSKLNNFLNGQRRQVRGSGDSGGQERLEEHSAREENGAAEWDREYQQRVFTWATRRVQGEFQEATWQAFWLTAVEGKSAREAGQQLGMSSGAVYVARSRVLARLKEEVGQLEGADPPAEELS